MRRYEAAGAAAVQIEDQTFPKRCGHLAGKQVVPLAEAAGRIRAAAQARRRPDTLIVGRTDALAVEGLDAALDRARAYAQAGADVLFVEAPLDPSLLAAVAARLAGVRPLLVNMVEAGPPSPLTATDLEALGYAVVIYPVALLRAAVQAQETVLRAIADTGSTAREAARMIGFEQLNERLGLPELLAAGRTYEEEG